MHRWAGLIVAAAMLSFGNAAAQDAPNPVMEHYRAYSAALQRGDLAAAETEAAAALAASEARDGDGGRTPVLVMNLAQVRVNAAKLAEAVAPARRAVAFAEAGAGGLDPIVARLVLGQAELSQSGRGSIERLQATLREARAAGGRESQIYVAALRLGGAAVNQRQFDDAITAYTLAIDLTQQGDPSAITARANALIGRGIAHMLGDDIDYVEGSTDTNTRDTPEGLAELDFAEAMRILRPQMTPTNGPALTQPQQLYANALAWSSALIGKLRTLGYDVPAALQSGGGFFIPLSPGAPMCPQTVERTVEPRAPAMALTDNLGVAAAVVRIVTDERGEIVERGVIASAGGTAYRDNVERVLPRWRVVLEENAPQPCSRASVMIFPQSFYVVREYR